MMLNFVMLALGLVSGFPKPDLVSVDIGSVQAGAGVVLNYNNNSLFLFPDLGLSVGQARLYWGKKHAFIAGLELFHIEMAGATTIGLWGSSECLMPQIGYSHILKPTQTIKSKGCLNPFKSRDFVPRMDIFCGFSPVDLLVLASNPIPPTYSPSLLFGAKIFISRAIQIQLENRNLWYIDVPYKYTTTFNTFHLSLCYSIGADYPNDKKGGDQELKDE
jgi:hypothetical protein